MRVATKKVYYCDYCKKRSLRSVAQHESRCTANPDRECHWMRDDEPHTKPGDLRPLIDWCKGLAEVTEQDVATLRDKLHGCPACMLAVFRIGRASATRGPDYHRFFNYTDAVQRFNDETAEAEYERELSYERAAMH